MYRIALACQDSALQTSLIKLFTNDLFQVIACGSVHRKVIRDSRNTEINLCIFDLEGANEEDLHLLSSVQAYGEFKVIIITSDEHPLPTGFSLGVHRSVVEQHLLEVAHGTLQVSHNPISRCC